MRAVLSKTGVALVACFLLIGLSGCDYLSFTSAPEPWDTSVSTPLGKLDLTGFKHRHGTVGAENEAPNGAE